MARLKCPECGKTDERDPEKGDDNLCCDSIMEPVNAPILALQNYTDEELEEELDRRNIATCPPVEYYVLTCWNGGAEHEVLGPFEHGEDEAAVAAKKFVDEDEGNSAALLEIRAGIPEVSDYSSAFLDELEEGYREIAEAMDPSMIHVANDRNTALDTVYRLGCDRYGETITAAIITDREVYVEVNGERYKSGEKNNNGVWVITTKDWPITEELWNK